MSYIFSLFLHRRISSNLSATHHAHIALVQASASLKPLCVDTALDTGPLDTVGKTSVSMETWLETALWKPPVSVHPAFAHQLQALGCERGG